MKRGLTLSTHFLGFCFVLAAGCGVERSEAQGPSGEAASPSAETGDEVAPIHEPSLLIEVPAGPYRPLYPAKGEPESLPVAAFQLELQQVTNRQFLAFVWAQPKWRRSQVPALFADESYLSHWTSDLAFDQAAQDAPVTNVSWFAARAYAAWCNRRLPTLSEWEYVAAASEDATFGREEPGYNQRILDWYSRPTPAALPRAGSGPKNYYGLADLHGLVWEWVEDFNTALVTGESRGDSGLDRNLFCGSGSINAADPSDYAAFMRFAFRSSLSARYSVPNLGFRCAQDAALATQE